MGGLSAVLPGSFGTGADVSAGFATAEGCTSGLSSIRRSAARSPAKTPAKPLASVARASGAVWPGMTALGCMGTEPGIANHLGRGNASHVPGQITTLPAGPGLTLGQNCLAGIAGWMVRVDGTGITEARASRVRSGSARDLAWRCELLRGRARQD